MRGSLLQARQQCPLRVQLQVLQPLPQGRPFPILLRTVSPVLAQATQGHHHVSLPGFRQIAQGVAALGRAGDAARLQPTGCQQQADVRALFLKRQTGRLDAGPGVELQGEIP